MELKACRRRAALVLAVALALAAAALSLPARAFADLSVDESGKTITVSDDYTVTTEIQDAIDYIAALDTDGTDSQSGAEDGWTITVSAGTYARFTVVQYLDYLTIEAANGAEVVISVLDDSDNPLGSSRNKNTYPETMGVFIQDADYLTIDGLTFKASEVYPVYDVDYIEGNNYHYAAVSVWNNNAGQTSENLTIKNCTFEGAGSNYGVFVSTIETWTVTGCSFDSFYGAICYMSDMDVAVDVEISSNTFTNCDRAVDGYYGSGYEDNTTFGTYKFINNTITGTEDLWCKVLISDDIANYDRDGHGNVTISGNTLKNANFLLFDINVVNDVLADNTYGDNSFVAIGNEASETVNFTFVTKSDSDQIGYWELLNQTTYEIAGGTYTLSDEEVAVIKAAIAKANATGSHTLTLDFTSIYENDTSNWWKCVTALKYAVHWVGTSDDTDDPTVDKTADATEVSAGDTVAFTLTATLPDYLALYDGEAGMKGATERGSYIITFHDVMDGVFTSNDDIVVAIGDTVIGSDYYTVTTSGLEDGCSFELTIDLIALYDDGLITDEDIEACAAITVTYTATVAKDTAAGSYDNTVALEYEYWTTDEVTVTVRVQKYFDLTVAKVWDDGDDADELRPESVTVSLYADGEATGKTVELSEENGWTATFEGLPAYAYDDDGEAVEVAYAVSEEAVDGYTTSYSAFSGSVEEGYSITVTNTHEVAAEEETLAATGDSAPLAAAGLAACAGALALAAGAAAKRRKRG